MTKNEKIKAKAFTGTECYTKVKKWAKKASSRYTRRQTRQTFK